MRSLSPLLLCVSLAMSFPLVALACGGSDPSLFVDGGESPSDAAAAEAAPGPDGARADVMSVDVFDARAEDVRSDAASEASAPTQCSKNGGTCEFDDGTALVDPCTATGRPIGAFACQDGNHICCLPK